MLFCLCVDPTDESEQVGASGSLEGHAHSRPDATSGDIQDKRQGLLTWVCTHKDTPLQKKKRGVKPRRVLEIKEAQVSKDVSVIINTSDIFKVCHVVVVELTRSSVQHVSAIVVCFICTSFYFLYFLWCHLISANEDVESVTVTSFQVTH